MADEGEETEEETREVRRHAPPSRAGVPAGGLRRPFPRRGATAAGTKAVTVPLVVWLATVYSAAIIITTTTTTTVRGQVVTQDESKPLNTPASLRCSLQTDKEVLIVTWQKIKATSPENMATFSENHGVVIQPPYKDRVNITQLGLRNSTLTFWNATVEDEGCFMCLFNTFGSGKISGKTCLTLYVPPTVSLHYEFFEDGLNVTCSATARPAPVIFWKVAGSGVENSTKMVLHKNGTSTVTSVLQFNRTSSSQSVENEEVICKVLHLGTVTDIRQTLGGFPPPTWIALIVCLTILLMLFLCYRIFVTGRTSSARVLKS
ncbi:vOX2-N [Elephant endotheliotropic herpesvirus 3B]|nr:vOX2-N [Elephant endotheliotropic herpesvirus 3B]